MRTAIASVFLRGVLLAVMVGCAALPAAAGPKTTGDWSSKTQLVWDGEAKKLVRRKLRVWDANPLQQLDFYWEPEAGSAWPATEVVEGRGTLSWRKRGTASYDHTAVMSTYKGELKDGRPHGAGRLETLDGVVYEGQWSSGLMHGEGHLKLENGDAYRGAFKGGEIDGAGVYTSASGESYEGAFSAGRRHGPGVLTRADGQKITGEWSQGLFVMGAPGIPQFAQWDQIGGQGDSSGITMAVTTDAKKNATIRPDRASAGRLTYRHAVKTGQIEILPDDDNLLHTWSDNGSAHTGEYFAYPEDDRFMYPAFLKLSFNGGGGTGLTLKEIVLDVERSDVETRPFIAAVGTGMQEFCGPEFQAYRPIMNITNTGWGTLQSAELSFSFVNKETGQASERYTKKLKPIDMRLAVSFRDELESLGLDPEGMKNLHFECFSREDRQECLDGAVRDAPLGNVRPFVGWHGTHMTAIVNGFLAYSWKDGAGNVRRSSAAFSQPILLTSVEVKNEGECGDLGPDQPAANVPILQFRPGEVNYKLTYTPKTAIDISSAGKGLTLGVLSERSSNSLLRVIAKFSDGRSIKSKPVRVLYFRPRPLNAAPEP